MRQPRLAFLLVVVTFFPLSAIKHTQALAQAVEAGIFEPVPEPTGDAVAGRGERRSRHVRFHRDRLFLAEPRVRPDSPVTAVPQIAINLFPDVSVDALLERVEPGTDGNLTWIGTISDWEFSTASLTVNGEAMAGIVQTRTAIYAIRPAGTGLVRIVEIDPAVARPDGDPLRVVPIGPLPLVERDADASDTIDVLVVYTAVTRANLRSGAGVTAWVNNQIANANTANASSSVTHRYRLVGIKDLLQPGTNDLPLNLQRLTVWGDGIYDDIHDVRDAVRADLVAMVVASSGTGTCGRANLMEAGQNNTQFSAYGFSVSVYDCDTQFSFAHELGHNLGANHAPGDPVSLTPVYPHAFGLKDPVGRFRTLMAYDCTDESCPRVMRVSHNTLNYNGRPQGSATQHNAGVFNSTAPSAANFRTNSPGRLPGIPGQPGVEVDVNNVVTIQWTAPTQGDAVTNYQLEAGNAEGASNIAVLPVGNATMFRVAAPRGRYYIRVRGQNAQGLGAPSDDRVFTVGDADPPAAPTNLRAAVNGSAVTLTWTPPVQPPRALGYILEAGGSSGSAAYRLPVGGTTFSTTAADGLYYARVRATNDAGAGPPSNEVSFRLGIDLPGAPTGLTAAIRQSNVVLTWSAPASGGPVEGYAISAGSSPGAANILSNVRIGNVLTYSANAPTGRYHVRVRAYNRRGLGPESNEAVVTPDSTICTGDVSATLTWNGPGDLDLHAFEPNGTHVFYSHKVGTTARLDRDNTSGWGPENICVNAGASLPGFYEILVVGFGGSSYPLVATITVRVKANTPQEQYQVFTRTIPSANNRVGHKVAAVDGRTPQIVNHTGTRSVDERGGLDEKPKN